MQWVRAEERNPGAYGEYRVRRRPGGRKVVEDRLLYNGDYWVTHGHGVCTSVVEWLEEEERHDDPGNHGEQGRHADGL